jgi:hypothetical protein
MQIGNDKGRVQLPAFVFDRDLRLQCLTVPECLTDELGDLPAAAAALERGRR